MGYGFQHCEPARHGHVGGIDTASALAGIAGCCPLRRGRPVELCVSRRARGHPYWNVRSGRLKRLGRLFDDRRRTRDFRQRWRCDHRVDTLPRLRPLRRLVDRARCRREELLPACPGTDPGGHLHGRAGGAVSMARNSGKARPVGRSLEVTRNRLHEATEMA